MSHIFSRLWSVILSMSFDLSINFLCKIVNNVAISRPKNQSCLVKLKTEAEELNIRKKALTQAYHILRVYSECQV